MEIISDNIDSKNLSFISDGSTGDDSNDKPRIIGNKSENVIYALNPLLSESLNNLVKRFERTKIPKPPPTKGHSIRKKSRIHSSLPNIFLPSIFDDNKCSEKKVQWTNKLNLDLEKMKILFRDNYNNWCKQKQRSQSIPNLLRNTDENDSLNSSSQNIDFICSRSNDENNMTIKFTKCDLKSTNESKEIEELSQGKPNLANTEDKSSISSTHIEQAAPNLEIDSNDLDDQVAYSTHIYLDGAIIEPISPATPVQSSQLPELTAATTDPALANTTQETMPNNQDQSLETSTTQYHGPAKNKRGRKPGKKKSKSLPTKKVKSDLQIIDLNSSKELKNLVESMEEAPRLEQETEIDPASVSMTELPDNIELISLVDEMQELQPTEIGSSPNQTNDLEILSKSITNSVDTSMLPPRKRYKRLMYLETNKPATTSMTTTPTTITISESQKDVVQDTSTVHEADVMGDSEKPQIPDDSACTPPPVLPETKPQSKPVAARSRSKRKKKTATSVKGKSQATAEVDAKSAVVVSTPSGPVECNLTPNTSAEPACALIDSVKPDPSIEKVVEMAEIIDPVTTVNPTTVTIDTQEIDLIKPTVKPDKIDHDKSSELPDASSDATQWSPKKSPGAASGSGSKKQAVKKSMDKSITEPSRKSAPVIVRPESLKRSKREAAARGFANMVAMSLNNSNSSQVQTGIDSKQQQQIIDNVASTVTTTTPAATAGKMFKRPRKTRAVEQPLGPTKAKQKRPSSPIASVPPSGDADNNGDKQLVADEAPPSPDGTITSSIDSISAGSGPVMADNFIKFRKIRTNTYIDPKPLYWFEEVERCGCKPSRMRGANDKTQPATAPANKDTAEDAAGAAQVPPPATKTKHRNKRHSLMGAWDCGDNCLNRLTFTECPARRCQCGDACGNQKIRRGEWSPGLQVRDFAGKGKGVVTTRPIRDGAFVIEYVGEVINERTFQERMTTVYRDDPHHYCLHLDGDMLIDAYRAGSLARFVNHSCQPNCEMQKWLVNGAYRMCLFAIAPIAPGTELSYDYNFCSFNTENTQICVCSAAACRGFIGSKPRVERSASQRDRKKLLYIFGRALSGREKLFIARSTVFLLRNRELGRCQRLGIRRSRVSHGNRLPSTISEIKRRKAKKNQFLTQMSALNSIRSIKTRQLRNAEENEALTKAAQLGQVLKDLYNTLLEQKDPARPGQQLVAPFIHPLNRRRYPEFYRMTGGATAGPDQTVASLEQVYGRLLDGEYGTMLAFDQDVLQMLHNVESYAGKQSTIGQVAERVKPVYRELKANSIALLEALTDEPLDERDKHRLLSNNLQLVAQALRTHSSSTSAQAAVPGLDAELPDGAGSAASTAGSQQRAKKRKQVPANHPSTGGMGARGRLERGAEVIKCVCGFLVEAGHVMVQCERCFVWQHAYCMNVARSAELADVTRMDPYYCHVCSGIPAEALVREIPRHFVISDETIGSDNTLFWTLATGVGHCTRDELLKIDDFVYISGPDERDLVSASSSPSALPPRKTIMRIYSLWKDCHGQRWMEGGLFLRPYDTRLRGLLERPGTIAAGPATTSSKRKSSPQPALDLDSHKWHLHEVVYTDLTTILPLNSCLGRCFVLNSYTFRHGRPLLQNASSTNIDVFVCDWMVNQHGHWSELDPAYLKINTKPYCFERFQDGDGAAANERFLRQYLEYDLRKIDEGLLPSNEGGSAATSPKGTGAMVTRVLSSEQRVSLKMATLNKLLNKLVDFAQQRNQNLPLSSTPSTASGSNPSSRGASPLSETSGSKSPIRPVIDVITHGPRKSLVPRKLVKNQENSDNVIRVDESDQKPIEKESMETVAKELTTIASDTSENSPQLVIVVDEFQQAPKADELQSSRPTSSVVERAPSIDDKDDLETKTVSSVKENVDEQSNLGSEINFGDFVNLLKSSADAAALSGPAGGKSLSKQQQQSPQQQQQKSGGGGVGRVQRKSTKKMSAAASRKKGSGGGAASRKQEIKPVSEIRPGEDEWIPVGGVVQVSADDRPRTRSRKILADSAPAGSALKPALSTVAVTTTTTGSGPVPVPVPDELDVRPESCSSSNNNTNTDVELILTGPNIKGIFTNSDNHPVSMTTSPPPQSGPALGTVTGAPAQGLPGTGRVDDDEDDSTKCCFVKLERMKMRQRQDRDGRQQSPGTTPLQRRGDSASARPDTRLAQQQPQGEAGDPHVSRSASGLHGPGDTQHGSTGDSVAPTGTDPGAGIPGSRSAQAGVRLDPSAPAGTAMTSLALSPSPSAAATSAASIGLSRSKRKKGVPKRIPFDFPYPQAPVQVPTSTSSLVTAMTPLLGALMTTPAPVPAPAPAVPVPGGFDDEIVDLSACRPTGAGAVAVPAGAAPAPVSNTQQLQSGSAVANASVLPVVVNDDVAAISIQQSSPATNADEVVDVVNDSSSSPSVPSAEPPVTAAAPPPPQPPVTMPVPETRHITAANDFSSIENISSN